MEPEPIENLVCRTRKAAGEKREQLFSELYARCRPIIRSAINHVRGLEHDDAESEANLAFLSAVRDYRRPHPFPAFCYCVVRRRLLSRRLFIVTPKRDWHKSISLAQEIEPSAVIEDILEDRREQSPQQEAELRDEARQLIRELRRHLSPFEWRCLRGQYEGQTFDEIAERLNCKPKSVDNAIVRAVRKIKRMPKIRKARTKDSAA